jgi:cellulose synthase operon protein C
MRRTATWAAMTALVALVALGSGCKGPADADVVASARVMIDKEDANGAILHLKSALQSNPQSAEARYLLGRALFMNGNAAGAVVELQRAASLKFNDELVLPWLAKAMTVAGQSKQVIDLYGKTTLATPAATAELKAAVAAAHATLGQMAACEAELDAALAADRSNVSARLQLARLTAGKGATDEALAQVDALLRDKPRLREAWLHKAQLLWISKHDIEGGKKAFEQALAIDPRYMEAHAGLAAMLLQQRDIPAFKARAGEMRKVGPGRFETLYFAGQASLLDGDFKGARSISQQLMQVAPNNLRVLQLAAAVEINSGSPMVAETHLRKVLAASPELADARRLLATAHLRSGEPDKALVVLKPLTDGAKPGFEELALAAEAYVMAGDLANAESLFRRAVQLNPAAIHLRTALALTQVAKGKAEAEAGIRTLEAISVEDPKSTLADMALINVRLRRGEAAAGLKAIDRLQEKLPDSPLPHHLRGQTLMRAGDKAGARKSFEQALAKDQSYFSATSSLATLDMADKRLDDARQRFQAVLSREPKNARALVALALLLNSTGSKPAEVAELLERAVKENPGEAAARLAQIDFLLGRHDTKAAIAAAEAAIASIPNDLNLLNALGRAQIAAGNMRQAVATFTTVATNRPNSVQAHLKLADAYLAINDQDNATRVLKRALEIAPDSVVARRSLVMVAVSRKRFDEALAIARQLQRDRPNESVGWQLQSDIHAIQKNWPAAIAAMRDSIQRAPSPEAAMRMVELFAAADRIPDADAFVSAWLKDHPRDSQVPFQLGAALLAKQDHAKAEAKFREVLTLTPEQPAALNNVAWLMVQQGKPGATAFAERALKVAPDQPQYMDTLALALAAEGNLAKAIEWQRKAVASAPADPNYGLGLSRLLIKAGDKALARQELERLKKLGPGFPNQAAVTELLRTL